MKLKLYKSTLNIWGYILLFLPIIFPVGIKQLYDCGTLITYLSVFASIIIWLIFIYKRMLKKKHFGNLFWFPIMFAIVLILVTIYYSESVSRSIVYGLQFSAVFLWAEIFIRDYGKRGLRALSNLGLLFAAINTIMLTVDPYYFGSESTYRRYCFISNDNSLLPFLLPSMVLSLILIELQEQNQKKKWIKAIIVFAVYSSSIYLTWTGTGVVIFTIFLAVFLLKFTGIWRAFNAKVAVILSLISVFLFTKVQIQNLVPGIFNVLEKDVTFSGRMTLWAMALQKLTSQGGWLFGFGMPESDLLFDTGNTRNFTAHNMFLQIILWGGLLLLAIFVVLIFISYRNVRKLETKYNSVKMYLYLGLFGMLYYYVFEVHANAPMFWVMLVVAYNVGTLCNIPDICNNRLIDIRGTN